MLGKRSPRSRVGGQLRLALHLATSDSTATCLDHTGTSTTQHNTYPLAPVLSCLFGLCV